MPVASGDEVLRFAQDDIQAFFSQLPVGVCCQ
jgi:hypothetical protein